MNNKALLQTFNNRNDYSDQTSRYSAVFAGKVGMALNLAAVIGKFEVPCSSVHKNLMNQAGSAETF